MMTSEEQFIKNTETMWKIRLAAWQKASQAKFHAEQAGVFHGERIESHKWAKAEKEAWLEETKKSSM